MVCPTRDFNGLGTSDHGNDHTSGDWAGGVWNAGGVPGQEESCAARTGFSTCEAFVRASGSAFREACQCFLSHHRDMR